MANRWRRGGAFLLSLAMLAGMLPGGPAMAEQAQTPQPHTITSAAWTIPWDMLGVDPPLDNPPDAAYVDELAQQILSFTDGDEEGGGTREPPAEAMAANAPLEETLYEVAFYAKDALGEYTLYQERGFENPQLVAEGDYPTLPLGTPDTYPGHFFSQWGQGATSPVGGGVQIYALYTPLSTVTVTVEFVRANDSTVIDAFQAVLPQGEALHTALDAPAIEGYHPEESAPVAGFAFSPGTGALRIDISSVQSDLAYRIVYRPNADVPYSVDHYLQDASGEYTLIITDTLSGPVGALTAAAARDFSGYALDTDLALANRRIEGGGVTKVRLEYKRVQYSVYYDAGTLGVLAEGTQNPVLAYYGDAIPMPQDDPMRTGYAFDKWVVGGGHTSMPAQDVEVVASWKPAAAHYSVVVWGQDADPNPVTGQHDTYSILDTFTATGTTGAVATYDPAGKSYLHFAYSHAEPGEIINGDGSSVLDVYYSRNAYTIRFLTNKGGFPFFIVNAKYRQDISGRYDASMYFTPEYNYRNSRWVDDMNTVMALPRRMLERSTDLYPHTESGTIEFTRYVYVQPLGADGQPVTDRNAYTLYGSSVLRQSGPSHYIIHRYGMAGYEYSYPELAPWDELGRSSDLMRQDGSGKYVNRHYYNLRSYTITYHDRGRSSRVDYHYTSDLSNAATPPMLNDAVTGYEGFVFDGWYITQDFSTARYEFAGARMPAQNLTLYAKWNAPHYTVSFVTGTGDALPPQQVPKWGYADEPAPPTFDTHVFQGWYLDAAFTTRFLFSQPITKDMTLYARWSGVDAVQVTVEHKNEAGDTLREDTYASGTLGQTVTVYPENIAGYLPLQRSIAVTLDAVGGKLVTMRYTQFKEVAYTVHYRDAQTGADLLPQKQVTVPTGYGTAMVTVAREIIAGYTADKLQKTELLVYGESNDIVFAYTRAGGEIEYTVSYYLQNSDRQTFQLLDTRSFSGRLGQRVTADTVGIGGYTYAPEMSTSVGTISSNAPLYLVLYYTLDADASDYTYQVLHIHEGTGDILESMTRTGMRYGQVAVEYASSATDLAYQSFEVEGRVGTNTRATATIKSGGVVFRFYYKLRYSISASAENGSVLPTFVQVAEGGDQALAYSAAEGFAFSALLVDGSPVDGAGEDGYTFTNVQADHTALVRFVPKVYSLTVAAAGQTHAYNGGPQGVFGAVAIGEADEAPLATATGLLPGHRLAGVTLAGAQQQDVGTYAGQIMPTAFEVRDAVNADVTATYTDITYVAGDLRITPHSGVGITITARDQSYIYSKGPQGVFGAVAIGDGEAPLAHAAGLLPGHRLAGCTLAGSRQTLPGTYAGQIMPTAAVIVDAQGKDVSSMYALGVQSYIPGDLIIHKKGNGEYDPETGGEMPLVIRARTQTFPYNGSPQGTFGASVPTAGTSLLAITGLLPGDTDVSATLSGSRQTEVDTYARAIAPSGLVIHNGDGQPVAQHYRIESTSYLPGDLIITPRSAKDVRITASDQAYVYNGQPQGHYGRVVLDSAEEAPLATATGLATGDRLAEVRLNGEQQTVPDTYGDAIAPTAAKIVNAAGKDVTHTYTLSASNYFPGTLTIHKKGNGETDPETGRELPLEITALTQRYIYNGEPQGLFGEQLALDDEAPIAAALALVKGHVLQRVTLLGEQQITPDTYTDQLMPADAVIVDEDGEDVTAHYRIEDESYIPGDLIIAPKGSNNPIYITAADQNYIYNGTPQGMFGEITIDPHDHAPLATASGLLFGHRLGSVVLGGAQQTLPDVYTDAIVPGGAVILDADGVDVTEYYLIEDSSYIAGTLTIHKKGNGEEDPETGGEMPLEIAALDQSYVYNGAAQGHFGEGLSPTGEMPLVTTEALVPGHALQAVSLVGQPRVDAGSYPGAIVPDAARIVDADGADVTENYLLVDESYHPGSLTIHPKGNGETDPETGGEMPLDITAADQTYIYNGEPQGIFGRIDLDEAERAWLATAVQLVPGHALVNVALAGEPQIDAGIFANTISPTEARIVDADGEDVTENYLLVDESYHPGSLTIHPKGNGETDPETGGEMPLDITAADQTYIYNGEPQGIFGRIDLDETERAWLATAMQLVPGHALVNVALAGEPQIDAGIYADTISPTEARIVDADGTDVTENYLLVDESYYPGSLTIHLKGNGETDPETGGEMPLDVTAADQTYIYNGEPQGIFGRIDLDETERAWLATAVQLVPGHALVSVTLAGEPKIDAGTYADTISPTEARIVDADGTDVTENYLLVDESYHPGSLTIHPKGNGETDPETGGEMPLEIAALDQSYVYNGAAQGHFGEGLSPTGEMPLVTTEALVPGHALQAVSLVGQPRVDAGSYPGAIVPDAARIVDVDGVDVTENYLLVDESYHPGTLTIHPKGNGEPNPETGGEMPFTVRARDQRYSYTGSPQGEFGETFGEADANRLATMRQLAPGHRVQALGLDGTQQTSPRTYGEAIQPRAIRIVDADGEDVTAHYLLTEESYLPGDLIIDEQDVTPSSSPLPTPTKAATPTPSTTPAPTASSAPTPTRTPAATPGRTPAPTPARTPAPPTQAPPRPTGNVPAPTPTRRPGGGGTRPTAAPTAAPAATAPAPTPTQAPPAPAATPMDLTDMYNIPGMQPNIVAGDAGDGME